MSILQVEHLRKSYGGTVAVNDVSFDIAAGEVFGLLGPNGAGKSTTINIIATLLRADAGTVMVDGVKSTNADTYKRRLGFVPQEISLAERLTARENLALIGRLYDLSGDSLCGRIDAVLERVGLKDRAGDLVKTFSGGMKRRLNIAAAILHDPILLLMDEPTAGVDPHARAHIFELVENLVAEGKAILYTTHYMEEAQRLCRRTAIIDHGQILAMGSLDELIQCVDTKRDLILEGSGLSDESLTKLSGAMGGVSWSMSGDAARLNVGGDRKAIIAAAQHAGACGIEPTSIRLQEANLETVFLEMTGRELRD